MILNKFVTQSDLKLELSLKVLSEGRENVGKCSSLEALKIGSWE